VISVQERATNIIKEELEKKGIKVVKIILFGSRARGDFKPDSDWDFLVVVDKEIKPYERREIIGNIQVKLAYYKISNDIIINSFSRLEEQKNDVGKITYYAMKYGVEV